MKISSKHLVFSISLSINHCKLQGTVGFLFKGRLWDFFVSKSTSTLTFGFKVEKEASKYSPCSSYYGTNLYEMMILQDLVAKSRRSFTYFRRASSDPCGFIGTNYELGHGSTSNMW